MSWSPWQKGEMDKMFENVVTAEAPSTWTERDKSKTKGEHSDFWIFSGGKWADRATHLQMYPTLQEKGI